MHVPISITTATTPIFYFWSLTSVNFTHLNISSSPYYVIFDSKTHLYFNSAFSITILHNSSKKSQFSLIISNHFLFFFYSDILFIPLSIPPSIISYFTLHNPSVTPILSPRNNHDKNNPDPQINEHTSINFEDITVQNTSSYILIVFYNLYTRFLLFFPNPSSHLSLLSTAIFTSHWDAFLLFSAFFIFVLPSLVFCGIQFHCPVL